MGRLAMLPEDLREIVLLRKVDGLSSQEVAERTGMSDAAVRKATVMIGSQSITGSQPASARMPTTRPKPSAPKSAVIQIARSQPGASSRQRPVRRGRGDAGVSCSSVWSWTVVNSCPLESCATITSVQSRLGR